MPAPHMSLECRGEACHVLGLLLPCRNFVLGHVWAYRNILAGQ